MAVIKRLKIKEFNFTNDEINTTFTKYNTINKIYEVAKENKINTLPFDIYNFLKLHKEFSLNFENMDELAIIEKVNTTYNITVNKIYNKQRQNFILAYIFGYILLYNNELIENKSIIIEINYKLYKVNKQVETLLGFATELMLPKPLVKQAIKDGYNTIEKLADLFNLPPITLRYRLHRLNIIKTF